MNLLPVDQRFAIRIMADTAPDKEPISLALARAHLNIIPYGEPPASEDDLWLTATGIPGARDWCERYIARSIGQKRIRVAGSGFPSAAASYGLPWQGDARTIATDGLTPSAFRLLMGPVRELVSVGYKDADGTAATIADAELDDFSEPQLLRPKFGGSWPPAQASSNSVVVEYLAGYDAPGDEPLYPLPPSILSAMLLILGHLYENRENTTVGRAANIQEIPLGAEALLGPYSLRNGFA